MKNTAAFTLFVLFSLSSNATDVMSKTEYRDHMNKVSGVAERLDQIMAVIDVDNLQVDYKRGKMLEKLRNTVLAASKEIRGLAKEQMAGRTLVKDLMINDNLSDIQGLLDSFVSILPATEEGNRLTDSVSGVLGELNALATPLRHDIYRRSIQLEEDIRACSKK